MGPGNLGASRVITTKPSRVCSDDARWFHWEFGVSATSVGLGILVLIHERHRKGWGNKTNGVVKKMDSGAKNGREKRKKGREEKRDVEMDNNDH